jgi:hypothetical protein
MYSVMTARGAPAHAQSGARRVDQHGHVAGLVLVLPHHLMG